VRRLKHLANRGGERVGLRVGGWRDGKAKAAQVSGGHDQAKPAEVWDAKGEKVPYTQDRWPYALRAVVILFILDLYATRVRQFGYRTIKFS
jgi:hypothetical protein